jgi:hypothetical protein
VKSVAVYILPILVPKILSFRTLEKNNQCGIDAHEGNKDASQRSEGVLKNASQIALKSSRTEATSKM